MLLERGGGGGISCQGECVGEGSVHGPAAAFVSKDCALQCGWGLTAHLQSPRNDAPRRHPPLVGSPSVRRRCLSDTVLPRYGSDEAPWGSFLLRFRRQPPRFSTHGANKRVRWLARGAEGFAGVAALRAGVATALGGEHAADERATALAAPVETGAGQTSRLGGSVQHQQLPHALILSIYGN